MQAIESFEVPTPPKVNYINAQYGLKSWLLTKDHKRIALLYLVSITAFFFLGGMFAFMIRLEADDFAHAAWVDRLAEAAHLSPGAFRQRFEYLGSTSPAAP